MDLYTWMDGKVQDVYYQTYTIAYDMAKKAEKAYRFEKGIDSGSQNIIDFGYWNVAHNGLLAGEQLYMGLRKLEQAYDETRAYDFEIKKAVSLRQLDAQMLYEIRSKGKCTFSIPEVIFDLDFQGHYRRRLKSVAVTFTGMPDGAGSVSATLTRTSHKYRVSIPTKLDYPTVDSPPDSTPDPTFQADDIPINSVAVSSPTVSSSDGDSGAFSLYFSSNTYQPFEGAGAISNWSLELSQFSVLDPDNISDVVIHLQYTASNAPSTYNATVVDALKKFMKCTSGTPMMTTFDLSVDIGAGAWQTFATPNSNPVSEDQETRTLSLAGLESKFPFYIRTAGRNISVLSVWLFTDVGATNSTGTGTETTIVPGTPSLSYTLSGSTASVSLKNMETAGGLARWSTLGDVSAIPLTGASASTLAVNLTGTTGAVVGMVLAVRYKVPSE